MVGQRLALTGALTKVFPNPNPNPRDEWFWALMFFFVVCLLLHAQAYGATRIPGTDASDKLEAAGTLLRIVDSILFSWGARLFAGLCVMSAGWHLKEQRFGMTILCVVAALVFGTAPIWVRNIFEIGGGGGIFSQAAVKKAGPHRA